MPSITCPVCERNVSIEIDPGEKAVHTYSNGDPGHPGSPANVEWIECGCDLTDDQIDSILEGVEDYEIDARNAAAEALMDARREEGYYD